MGTRPDRASVHAAGVLALTLAIAPRRGAAQPAAPQGSPTVVNLVIHGRTVCGLRTDGRVLCWGSNEDGGLGVGRTPMEDGPVAFDRPTLVAGVESALELTADGDGLCARSPDAWRCWGPQQGATGGQLSAAPAVVPARASRRERQATYGRECVLDERGTVRCRGNDERTNGGARDGATFTTVEGLPPAAQLAMGTGHTCAATTDGAVYCWGLGSDGQLGAPAVETCRDGADDHAPCARRPLRVGGLGRVVQIAAVRDDTCVRTAEGSLSCWGRSWVPYERRSTSRPVPWGGPAIELFAMVHRHVCAVAVDHSVWCAQSANGQERAAEPTRIARIDHAVRVAVGEEFGCALEQSGEVRCWGDDGAGQLGDGAFDPPWRAGPGRALRVVAAHDGAHALLEDGTVRFTPLAPAEGAEAFRPIEGVVRAADLAGGSAHACALLEGGRVLCWGSNAEGALGVGDRAPRSTPVEPVGLPPLASLVASGATTCGWTASGEVWCWGEVGMFGRGRRSTAPAPDVALRPRRIRALRRVRRMTFHQGGGCALDARGRATCWGLGAGCRGPVDVAALRDATELGAGSALTWRAADGRWRGYIPYNVCEDAGESEEDNCRVSIATRQRAVDGVDPALRSLSSAAHPCAGYSACGVDDQHRLRCSGGREFVALTERVTGAAQAVMASSSAVWVTSVDGRVALVSTEIPPRAAAVSARTP